MGRPAPAIYAGRVYEIALSVAACLRAGTRVDVAWAVEASGFSSRDKSEALAITPGGGRIGSVLSGSLNDQLADLAERGRPAGWSELHAGDLEATLAGLACGGDARCVLVPAADLPDELWERLRHRDPVCLVTRGSTATGWWRTGCSAARRSPRRARRRRDCSAGGPATRSSSPDSVVTVLWPVPKLVIIGGGAIADALAAAAGLLGWRPR